MFSAFLPLRGYDKKGRFVLLIRIGAINPAKITFGDVMRVKILDFYESICMSDLTLCPVQYLL